MYLLNVLYGRLLVSGKKYVSFSGQVLLFFLCHLFFLFSKFSSAVIERMDLNAEVYSIIYMYYSLQSLEDDTSISYSAT